MAEGLPGLPLRSRNLVEWRSSLSWLLLICVSAVFAARSWRKWCDLLIDFGHELYIPWRMSEGDVLYRDITFTMGPLSQHYHALLFRVFGTSLMTLVVSNLLIGCLIVWLIVQVFSDDPAVETSGTQVERYRFLPFGLALVFLTVFAFGQYAVIASFNYVTPYRHEVTHGLALGLISLFAWRRYLSDRRLRWCALAATCVGFTWLTKVELAVPATMAALVALASVVRCDRSEFPRILSVSAASFCAPLLIAWGVLAGQLGLGGAALALSLNLRLALRPELTSQSGFFQSLMGTDAPVLHLLEMAEWWLVFGIGLLAGWSIDWFSRRTDWIWGVGLLAGAYLGMLLGPGAAIRVSSLFPAFIAVWLGWSIVCWVRGKPGAEWQVMLGVYAATLMLKVALNPLIGHYGFALTMLPALLFVRWLTVDVPTVLGGAHRRGFLRGLAVGVVVGVCGILAWSSDRIYQAKRTPMGDGLDRFFVDSTPEDERVIPTLAVLSKLRAERKPGETLYVIPEGATLNYLLRMQNPTGILMTQPWEIAAFDAQLDSTPPPKSARSANERFWNRVEASPADFVVEIHMDMLIHGAGQLGDPTFGGDFMTRLRRDYRLIDRQEVPGRGFPFWINVYRKKSAADGGEGH